MNVLVIYESFWGNTAAVAQAVAEGLGPGARAVSTTEASAEAMSDLDLVVAGAPVLAFNLATEKVKDGLRTAPGKAPKPPDLSHPLLRTWLESLPAGHGYGAAFETRVRGPFGHAAKVILERLERAGYRQLAEPGSFIVKGRYGPLRDGELDRAREWGAALAKTMGDHLR
jgi:hypothetical protein